MSRRFRVPAMIWRWVRSTQPGSVRAFLCRLMARICASAGSASPSYRDALARPVQVDASGVLDTIGRTSATEKGGAASARRFGGIGDVIAWDGPARSRGAHSTASHEWPPSKHDEGITGKKSNYYINFSKIY